MESTKKEITPEKARKLLNKLPNKFIRFKTFAEEASKNDNDEYVLSVFKIIKNSNNSERIIPYTWEIEYEIDKCNYDYYNVKTSF